MSLPENLQSAGSGMYDGTRDYGDTSSLRLDQNRSTVQKVTRWSRFRGMMQGPVAEFLGVMVLVIFGAGANCQVVLSSHPGVASSQKGSYLSINFGWAIGVAMGVWIAGGISGGHLNPAVTLAFATWRGFPLRRVPTYIFAQLMGGIVGAALIYANYVHAIDIFEGGEGVRTLKTAGLFATYALEYMPNASCFFSEVFATTILLVVILAVSDKRNTAPPSGLAPVAIFLLILGLGIGLGMETGYAMNPARDLGPRLLTSMVGYGSAVYSYRSQYWLWCPIIAPIIGAQLGMAVYDICIYDGEDGVLNQSRVLQTGKTLVGDDRI